MRKKKYGFIQAIALISVILTLGACSVFRRKNRCNDCPKWSQVEPNNITIKEKNTSF